MNNAGLAIFKPLEEQTLEDWNFVMDTNLKSAFLMSHTVVPYSATKGGLLGMAKAMVAELSRHNINVNTISPGSTITPGNRLLENPVILDKINQRTARGTLLWLRKI